MTFAWEFVLTVLLTTAAVCLAEIWQAGEDRDSRNIQAFRDPVKKGH